MRWSAIPNPHQGRAAPQQQVTPALPLLPPQALLWMPPLPRAGRVQGTAPARCSAGRRLRQPLETPVPFLQLGALNTATRSAPLPHKTKFLNQSSTPLPCALQFFAWAPPGVEPPLRQPGAGSGRGGGSQPLSPGAARHGSQQQPGGSQPGGSQQQRQQVGSPYAGSQPGSQAHTPVGRRPPATFSQTSPGAQPAPGESNARCQLDGQQATAPAARMHNCAPAILHLV